VLLNVMAFAERIGALVAFFVLLPFLAVMAGVIALLSGEAPLVAHRRLGRHGAAFWMLKFRTMWPGTRGKCCWLIEWLSKETVPEIKTGNDPRVTSRSLDELPQIWHVARGEMSLVGPRPMTPAEWDKHYGGSSVEVLRVKPGLTGLWQIRGRNRLTYRQRRRFDLFLARHYCLWLYMRILGRTIPQVLAGRDAW
jgi:lipopolysaccharide/colanic/teichoic acid biosynthesis glycosyltransferase